METTYALAACNNMEDDSYDSDVTNCKRQAVSRTASGSSGCRLLVSDDVILKRRFPWLHQRPSCDRYRCMRIIVHVVGLTLTLASITVVIVMLVISPILARHDVISIKSIADDADASAHCHISSGSGVPSQPISGTVDFTQPDGGGNVTITVKLSGFNTTDGVTVHGFHVHVNGLIGNQCNDSGAHYNPFNVAHGAPNSTIRHVGDLGNIVEDSNGNVNYVFSDNIISLLPGSNSIIKRSIVVHAMPDDLGLGNFSDSNTTGHAGARIGCCVIDSTTSGATSLLTAVSAVIFLAVGAFAVKK